MKHTGKKYGDTKTNLTLNEKAASIYADSDFEIYEEQDGSYSLYINNGLIGFGYSEDDINEIITRFGGEDE